MSCGAAACLGLSPRLSLRISPRSLKTAGGSSSFGGTGEPVGGSGGVRDGPICPDLNPKLPPSSTPGEGGSNELALPSLPAVPPAPPVTLSRPPSSPPSQRPAISAGFVGFEGNLEPVLA